ncbi:MAG TPA: helix-turn-helix domain-containing protein [Clostridiales bacterium]|nr:helix-turn-helix domain-containing protein [Clostridiales bacterium]
MDNNNSITKSEERKRGQHLGAEERGIIQGLKRLGYFNRAIAREIHCSPSTVGYELQRGTAEYSGRGRKPSYSAKRGGKIYHQNRRRCRRPKKHLNNTKFIIWMAEMVRLHKWSLSYS